MKKNAENQLLAKTFPGIFDFMVYVDTRSRRLPACGEDVRNQLFAKKTFVGIFSKCTSATATPHGNDVYILFVSPLE